MTEPQQYALGEFLVVQAVFNKQNVQSGLRRDSFLDVSFVILLALFLALLLKTYVAEAYMIRGHSMEPTFSDNQRVMVQKVFFDIERGDVIIFSSKEDPRKDLIKRVVGLPGDQVHVVDGEVYLNGKKLEEDYTTPYRYARGEVYPPYVVPDDTVFVLGDNRPESQDSRAFDAILMSSIKGKVILRWWPAAEIRTF